jgi:DNA-binding MarR family transcriptional regulator
MPSVGVQASAAILRLARDLRTALDQRCAPLGLTSQQAGVLIYVFTGLTSGKQLAEALGTDSAGITRLLDRLEAKGYLARSPDPTDRRAQAISLTESGRALVPDLPGLFEDVASDMLHGVDAGRVYLDTSTMLENLLGGGQRPAMASSSGSRAQPRRTPSIQGEHHE